MNKNDFTVIILAGGKGTRMMSPLPKVMHPVAGRPMLQRVIESVKKAGAREVRVVVGYGEKLVKEFVEPLGAITFKQQEQLGTADAVRSANVDSIEGRVLILNGDHPLLTVEDIKGILSEHNDNEAQVSVVAAEVKNPGAFGRIVRNGKVLMGITEASEASAEELKIKEINTGIYVVEGECLQELLPKVGNDNKKGEYYLTDIIALAKESDRLVGAIKSHRRVAFGVNTQIELAKAGKYLYQRKNKRLMKSGVMITDPGNTYIEETVEIGEASVIHPGCFIRGKTKIGKFSVIEPHVSITDCEIGENVHIKAGCYLDSSKVDSKVTMGPYAHIRPQTVIHEDAKIGNFVELKKVEFGARSKANHLTYLGDATVGEDTNIGCGTITCNYAADKKKYRTEIGDNVFVGSDVQFVAPIKVGDDSFVGSGSTITKDIPQGALGVARGKQFVKENYKPKSKD